MFSICFPVTTRAVSKYPRQCFDRNYYFIHRRTHRHTNGYTDGWTDRLIPVHPRQHSFCGGIIKL